MKLTTKTGLIKLSFWLSQVVRAKLYNSYLLFVYKMFFLLLLTNILVRCSVRKQKYQMFMKNDDGNITPYPHFTFL